MVWQDIATVGTLAVLEGLLSADNALVLAVLVKHLPSGDRKKALRYGIWGAFIFRIICVLVASWLIHAWYFKAAGAAYLIYIATKHLLTKEELEKEAREAKHLSFWKTVAVVEFTDIVFSVDSILAAVAMSSKIWVIYFGGVVGIIAMRFVAGIFIKMIENYPGLEKGGYILVGWVGIKLALETAQETIKGFPYLMPTPLFWLVMAAIFFGSMLWKRPIQKHLKPPEF